MEGEREEEDVNHRDIDSVKLKVRKSCGHKDRLKKFLAAKEVDRMTLAVDLWIKVKKIRLLLLPTMVAERRNDS